MSDINLDKLQKLWNHATKNANKHEASTAALMFTKMIAKHGLKVHLYSGQAPATEQQIKEAIDKAYIKGQMEAKETYSRILERRQNEFYNEGFRDGQANSYTKADLNRAYNKGFAAGQRHESKLVKAYPTALTGNKLAQGTGNIVCSSSTSSKLFLSNGTTSATFTIKCNGL